MIRKNDMQIARRTLQSRNRKFLLILFAMIFSTTALFGQVADSVRVEQTGDFIKIRYKILNSEPSQIFRVKVLCEVNGGLLSELRSVSGDVGEQVMGGKKEYWVVWDVLSDVAELTSADFVVRTELVSGKVSSISMKNKPTQKYRFHLHGAIQGPGPQYGVRVGFSGAWGVSSKYMKGKMKWSDWESPVGYTPISFDPEQSFYSTSITKRIVNYKDFQLHALAGVSFGSFLFFNADISNLSINWREDNLLGPELGIIFGIKNFTAFGTFSHFDPKPVEEEYNMRIMSEQSYLNFGVGLRF